MASAKIATLLIRTVAKPISSRIKDQARQHDQFRKVCINLAQFMYRTEVKMRTNLLGEPAKHIRPLSETRAIENGANALAEGFLFAVAAGLIIGESWRSARSETRRRGNVDDQLEELGVKVGQVMERVERLEREIEGGIEEERQKNDELARILERVVEIGLRGGWAEFQDTPLKFPRIELVPRRQVSSDSSSSLSPDPEPPSSAPSEDDSRTVPSEPKGKEWDSSSES
ncbi:optic atrophy 3 protein-domain-containing protein [Cyathus striatus]|nr:optic atrophy 3 protein-domain-containing protein [Cyathus striatus]